MAQNRFTPRPTEMSDSEPFASAEEAWFWFVQCRLAQQAGARVAAGMARIVRPCEPLDVLAVVDRQYRRRRLLREHLMVLSDFGARALRPDRTSPRESRAAALWDEAFAVLAPAFEAKGIIATEFAR